ncbi:MAG: DUF1194 domain-containing protein [Kiloniellales bacterium]
MRLPCLLLCLLFAVLPLAGAAQEPAQGPAAEPDVDVELCLAADGSGSIADDEFVFQRRGFAAAIADPRVLRAIERGLYGRIALAHMEWGGSDSMEPIVDWMVIEDAASARAFGERLIAAPRRAIGWNSISNAILFCLEWIESNDFNGLRKIIDISGDAGQRGGAPLPFARSTALDAGLVINALALNFRGGGLSGPMGMPLLEHFNRDVIGGPGAFSLAVETSDAFVEALVRKLILEIAGKTPADGGERG